jgi:transcription initiation factor TFIIH subunit 2
MLDRDMRPTRFDLSLEYSRAFVTEWFDQNPLGQIGVVGMRGGIGERVADMSGKSYCLRQGTAAETSVCELAVG